MKSLYLLIVQCNISATSEAPNKSPASLLRTDVANFPSAGLH